MEPPKDKRTRLEGFDYSQAGAYFVTVCTKDRACILSDVIVGAIHESPVVRLTQYGQIVEKHIKLIPERFHVEIGNYIIMPNHIHMIIVVDSDRAIRESPLQKRALIPKVIGYLKMNSSKEIHFINPDITVWQRSFRDHIIRNEKEYSQISEYIEYNACKWEEDCYYTHEQT